MYWVFSHPLSITAHLAFFIVLVVRFIKSWWRQFVPLWRVPTIGPSLPVLSYFGAFRYLVDSSGAIEEGYRKYKDFGMFKIATLPSWLIIVNGPTLIEDIRKAPADVLEFDAAIDEAMHILGPKVERSHFHVPIVTTQLTRQLHDSFSEIHDEVVAAIDDLFNNIGKDWQPLGAFESTLNVVTRVSHRLFVGLPLCRDPEYVALTAKSAIDIGKAAAAIRLVPRFLRLPVGKFFAEVPSTLQRLKLHLRPLFKERKQNEEAYGKGYTGQPEDMLAWFMEKGFGSTDEERLTCVAFHFLIVNFGAVYTTSLSFTQALYHLVNNPELIKPLREEIEAVTARDGWTKPAMGQLRKLDSVLKESQRLSGLAAVSTYRRVLKPFVFSNGVEIPAGSIIAVAAHSTHLDDAVYPDAMKFDGLRFINAEGENALMVTPSPEYLPFGMGRTLCPGRFFSVVVMKAFMAHLLLYYDIKLDTEGRRPESSWFVTENMPDVTAKVMFKRRQDVDRLYPGL